MKWVYFLSLEIFQNVFKVVKKAAAGWNTVIVFACFQFTRKQLWIIWKETLTLLNVCHSKSLHADISDICIQNFDWLSCTFICILKCDWPVLSSIAPSVSEAECICFAAQALVWRHILSKLFSGLLLRLYKFIWLSITNVCVSSEL